MLEVEFGSKLPCKRALPAAAHSHNRNGTRGLMNALKILKESGIALAHACGIFDADPGMNGSEDGKRECHAMIIVGIESCLPESRLPMYHNAVVLRINANANFAKLIGQNFDAVALFMP